MKMLKVRGVWVSVLSLLACAQLPASALSPQLTVSSASVREGNTGQSRVTLSVKRAKYNGRFVRVTFSTQDGTARAGEDYSPFKTTITLSPSQLQSSFQVTILGDRKVEPNEKFFIQAQTRDALVQSPAASITIINDDGAPQPTPTVASTPSPTVLPTPTPAPSASIRMVAYQDTWAEARERWWDMGAVRTNGNDKFNQFNDWLTQGNPNGQFDYSQRATNVVLTYQRNPSTPYFVGHISAKGLKPNFVYQLKLTGKPVSGPRGTGTSQSYVAVSTKSSEGQPQARTVRDSKGQPIPINGDDWTNQQLGYAGRWWNDSNASGNTNAITDDVYASNTDDTIYGYQFLGDFVTDSKGNAETDIKGNRSYHITWQDWQSGIKDVFFGSFNVRGFLDRSNPPHYFGYGAYAPSMGDAAHDQNGLSKVSLWYELQSGRPDPVVLPSGTYHCRLLVTEETFHNMYGATDNLLGGKWKTVMATEERDIASGAPDSNPNNDIVFSIR